MRIASEAVGSDGQVIPQWLVHINAPGVPADDRRRLDLVVYGATPRGGALCCDATLVSPFARTGNHAQPGAADTDGAVLRVAERRKRSAYPELCSGGPQELVVLGSEARLAASCRTCSASGCKELRQLSAARPPRAGRAVGGAYWLFAVQQAVASTALGQAWPVPLQCQRDEPPLERVLELAGPAASPSRLPLRS